MPTDKTILDSDVIPRRWSPRMVGGTADQTGAESAAVAIVLSVYNGEAFLNDQLDSIVAQTHDDWVVYWRDDGSDDASRAIMLSFQAHRGHGRCTEVTSNPGRLGITASYMALLSAVEPGRWVAFADQDDVWLPQKLAWAVASLNAADAGPALYCGRQYLTDAALHVRAESVVLRRRPTFESALTQNIATGHTIMINAVAHALLRGFPPPPGVLHDWWAYLVVSGAGGQIVADGRCVSYYRQHQHNAVGAQHFWLRRGVAALRRGPDSFMRIFSANIEQLAMRPEQLVSTARALVTDVQRVLPEGAVARLRLLGRWRGLMRQTRTETGVFRLWFVLSSGR